LPLKDSITPDIEPRHVGQLRLKGRQLLCVTLRIEVAWCNRRLEKVLAIWTVIGVQQNTVEVLVELRRLILHQELDAVHELAFLAALLALGSLSAVQVLA
jgi:hypothetical protein